MGCGSCDPRRGEKGRTVVEGLAVAADARVHAGGHKRPGVVEGVETPLAVALRVVGSLRSTYEPQKGDPPHEICALFVAELPRSVRLDVITDVKETVCRDACKGL